MHRYIKVWMINHDFIGKGKKFKVKEIRLIYIHPHTNIYDVIIITLNHE